MLRAALAGREPVVAREPGGTELGERLRELLLHSGLDMAAETEMLLFMAARAELVSRVIAPALSGGRIVIADRYHDSTLAYQGGGRGVATWWPASFPIPDRTFLLDLPAEVGLGRRRGRGGSADRLESEGLAFHQAVASAYRELAEAQPERWVRLDASRPAAEVHQAVMTTLGPLLGEFVAPRSGGPTLSGGGGPGAEAS
jgi:dTMP kinase